MKHLSDNPLLLRTIFNMTKVCLTVSRKFNYIMEKTKGHSRILNIANIE